MRETERSLAVDMALGREPADGIHQRLDRVTELEAELALRAACIESDPLRRESGRFTGQCRIDVDEGAQPIADATEEPNRATR